MPKYVVDFDAIDSTVSKLNETASSMKTKLKNSKIDIDNELSSWIGDSSTSMQDTNNRVYKNIASDIATIENMASYMQEASNLVQAAEDTLSSYRI